MGGNGSRRRPAGRGRGHGAARLLLPHHRGGCRQASETGHGGQALVDQQVANAETEKCESGSADTARLVNLLAERSGLKCQAASLRPSMTFRPVASVTAM